MFLDSKIVALEDSDYVLATGLQAYQVKSPEPFPPELIRVERRRLGSVESADLTAACTLPRPASKLLTRYWKQQARLHAKLAQSKRNSKWQRQSYETYQQHDLQKSQLFGQAGLWQAANIARYGGDSLLVGIFNGTDLDACQSLLRVVNAQTGDIEWELAEHAEELNIGAEHRAGFLAAGATEAKALFVEAAGRGKDPESIVVERCIEQEDQPWPQKHISPHAEIVASASHWVVFDRVLDRDVIKLIEQRSGKVARKYSVKGAGIVSPLECRAGLLATLRGNGWVNVLQLTNGETHSFPVFDRASADCSGQVSLSASGQWLAARMGESLHLLRLADGALAELPPLQRTFAQGEGLAKHSISNTLAFVGDTLVIYRDATIEEVDPLVQQFDVPTEAGMVAEDIEIEAVAASWSIERLCSKFGLDKAAQSLSAFHQPGVLLISSGLGSRGWNSREAGGPPLAGSRLGGWPDLPAEVEWPSWEGRPMAFLAQVDLAEVHTVNPDVKLPQTGLLSFFLGSSSDTYRPEEGSSTLRYHIDFGLSYDGTTPRPWRVLFFPDNSALQQKPYLDSPQPDMHAPASCRPVTCRQLLPDERSAVWPQLPLNAEERERYVALWNALQGMEPEPYACQLMGYPHLLQNERVEEFCELAERGLNPYQGVADEKIAEAATEWCLLLQLISDANAEFEWGDGGHLYFYIRRSALEALDFSETYLYFEN